MNLSTSQRFSVTPLSGMGICVTGASKCLESLHVLSSLGATLILCLLGVTE